MYYYYDDDDDDCFEQARQFNRARLFLVGTRARIM